MRTEHEFSCDGSGCHVTAEGSRVRGDKIYITERGTDVVHQTAYGNGLMYGFGLKNVLLGTYNVNVMNICLHIQN